MKEFWDFDENKNYKTIYIENIPYKVLYKYKDYIEAVNILYALRNILKLMCIYLSINFYKYSKKEQSCIKCFLDIHFNSNQNYYLSEMQLNTQFNGLNKPRELYLSLSDQIGKDGKYRAKYRHIFLTLRKKDGNFKTTKSIIDLFIHEITHTMCNHITWRDDDHNEDFESCEKLLINVFNKIK